MTLTHIDKLKKLADTCDILDLECLDKSWHLTGYVELSDGPIVSKEKFYYRGSTPEEAIDKAWKEEFDK